jgi:hypothetical protein
MGTVCEAFTDLLGPSKDPSKRTEKVKASAFSLF